MKKTKPRRAGATETFSVSVDPETKRALRKLADSDYQGNLSALVSDFAEDARRRMAAAAYLRRHGMSPPSQADVARIQAELEREIAAARKRRKSRKVA
jgi:hypothetical protein